MIHIKKLVTALGEPDLYCWSDGRVAAMCSNYGLALLPVDGKVGGKNLPDTMAEKLNRLLTADGSKENSTLGQFLVWASRGGRRAWNDGKRRWLSDPQQIRSGVFNRRRVRELIQPMVEVLRSESLITLCVLPWNEGCALRVEGGTEGEIVVLVQSYNDKPGDDPWQGD